MSCHNARAACLLQPVGTTDPLLSAEGVSALATAFSALVTATTAASGVPLALASVTVAQPVEQVRG